ncbi:MAG: hypothetical protein JNL44_02705 [Gemmatimonadetes bacterium]|nr:hypothetical protein [Gemmatimonadota bacterium]
MPLVVGLTAPLLVALYARLARLDRERSFYPTVLAAIASTYLLFAAIDGSLAVVGVEAMLASVFFAAAAIGFRWNLWLVVAGLAAHGIMDAFHGGVVENSGVPAWWPAFCATYDLVAAALLARLLFPGRAGRPALAVSAEGVS